MNGIRIEVPLVLVLILVSAEAGAAPVVAENPAAATASAADFRRFRLSMKITSMAWTLKSDIGMSITLRVIPHPRGKSRQERVTLGIRIHAAFRLPPIARDTSLSSGSSVSLNVPLDRTVSSSHACKRQLSRRSHNPYALRRTRCIQP